MSAPVEIAGAAPIVVLDGVFARDAAGPRGASRGPLLGATAALGTGVHAFLGAPEDGTIALCDALAGVRRPLRGTVRVGGDDPWTSPAARARIGALLAAPDLPEARSVRACVELALTALGRGAPEAGHVLSELGLGSLASRPTAALSFAEARAVELALALAVVKRASPPAVLVLFEPCADLAAPAAARAIDEILAAQRAAGACVVLATSSPADARRLGDEIWILHRGLVIRHEPAGSQALAFGDAEIAVTLSVDHGAALRTQSVTMGPPSAPDPSALRVLAATLAGHPAVCAALWDDPPQGSGRPPTLRVRGPDRDACALAVIDAAAGAGVALASITSAVPDLTAARSAAVAWVQRARGPAQPVATSKGRSEDGAPGRLTAHPVTMGPQAAPNPGAQSAPSAPPPPAGG